MNNFNLFSIDLEFNSYALKGASWKIRKRYISIVDENGIKPV
jgi:hypothetical protein